MSKRLPLVISLWLGVFTFAIYWPVIYNRFVDFDDHLYVLENPWVQDGLTLDGMVWAFCTRHASNWHPLTWLSHMLDCELFGLFPGGHHLSSLILHAANAMLLFLLLKRLTGAVWRSTLVAALFAWHPLHVESVAWVSERKDVLSAFFWILTIWAYARYVERPGRLRYAASLGLFALGLMAKPMGVTLPCVLLLLDYWPLNRFSQPNMDPTLGQKAPSWRSWLCLAQEKIPFFALSAISCLVTIWVQHKGGAIKSFDTAPFGLRCANALAAYGTYLQKMTWPSSLAVFYPMPMQTPTGRALLSGLLMAFISVCAFVLRKRRPFILVGWLWFVGTLVPVIGLLQVGAQSMADRYTYIPLIGIFIVIAWGLAETWVDWRLATPLKLATCGLILGACAFLTARQLESWQDGATLFEQAVRVTRSNHITHAAYGIALSAQGRSSEAIEQFSEALRINPDHALSHVSLAAELSEQGKTAEAIEHLNAVLQLRADPGAHNNLGILLAKEGRLDEAIEHFNSALRLNPDHLKARLNLAMAFNKQGKTADAIACYREALKLQPPSPEVFDRLAWIMATHDNPRFRDAASALRLAKRATELSHRSNANYLDTLAAAYAENGLFKEAMTASQEALQIASASGQTELTTQIQNRVRLYQEGKPFREIQ